MATSDRQLLDLLSRTPFIDSTELALILGEPHATVHRALGDLLAEGIAGRVHHGTAHLPSSQRYHLTAQGIREATEVLGFETPSDFVRAYPASREWLTLLIRRMDAVASVYRLAASMSPGIDGLRSLMEFHRRGRFDATITLHDGRDFGVVRQGLALRHRSLYDRLRAIAEYDYTRHPDTVLVLVPSVWEERLTTRFCEDRNLGDCYVAVESRDALERRDLRLWCSTSWVIGSRFFTLGAVSSHGSPGGRRYTESPERKRASLPRPERMAQAAPAFGVSPAEKRTLDILPLQDVFLTGHFTILQEFETMQKAHTPTQPRRPIEGSLWPSPTRSPIPQDCNLLRCNNYNKPYTGRQQPSGRLLASDPRILPEFPSKPPRLHNAMYLISPYSPPTVKPLPKRLQSDVSRSVLANLLAVLVP